MRPRRRLGVDTITVLHAPLADDGHNNMLPDWAHATSTIVRNCSADPGASLEYLLNRDTSLIAWTVFAPAGTAVEATDRVKFNGVTYEVWGEPLRWNSASGHLDHVVIMLQKWGG